MSGAEDAQRRWPTGVRYSVCTMVTRPEQYASMIASFRDLGFAGTDCEFLKVDNTAGNALDAFQSCNLFLSVARGDYILICHQDVRLMEDGRARLDDVIADMDRLDPDWALLGNSGCVAPGRQVSRISDPHGENQNSDALPVRVVSLDENFIVVRRDANLAVSHDLSGFHLYGADLCVIAALLGRHAYVVDFHLRHLSGGVRDRSLEESEARLANKYARAFRSRWMMTPSAMVYLSGNAPLSRFMNASLVARGRLRLGRWIHRRG